MAVRGDNVGHTLREQHKTASTLLNIKERATFVRFVDNEISLKCVDNVVG
jgi:hypothetical protein